MSKLFFAGIGGSGVSALAQIMKLKGNEVLGSDRNFDLGNDQKNKKALEEIGIKIFPQDGSGVTKDIDTVFISTALLDTNPDIKKALEYNIPIKKRFDLLAEIFHQYTHNIAVAGTSGKTTTTAMIGYILNELKQKPVMINGGLLKNYEDQKGIPNIIYNEGGDICVIEADESNGSINEYHPYIALINNISLDHKPLEELMELFENFALRAKHALVINIDDPNAQNIRNPHKKNVTISIKNSHADFYASNIQPLPNGTKYTLDGKEFTIGMFGKFNVANALAAIASCSILGIDKFDSAKVLESFKGTVRRMEIMGTKKGITFISDFAHNPHKVEGTMSALKLYPNRVMIVFQGHGFAAMRLTGMGIIESFAKTMSKEDILVLPDIYDNGLEDKVIKTQEMVDYALKLGVNVVYIPSKEDVKTFVLQNAKEGDTVVVMGARDTTLPDFCRELLKDI